MVSNIWRSIVTILGSTAGVILALILAVTGFLAWDYFHASEAQHVAIGPKGFGDPCILVQRKIAAKILSSDQSAHLPTPQCVTVFYATTRQSEEVGPFAFGEDANQNPVAGYGAEFDASLAQPSGSYISHLGTAGVLIPRLAPVGSNGEGRAGYLYDPKIVNKAVTIEESFDALPFFRVTQRLIDPQPSLDTRPSTEPVRDTPRFFSDLNEALQREPTGKKKALLFVHGWKQGFDQSVMRTAELSVDLMGKDFDSSKTDGDASFSYGQPIVYSWPTADQNRLVTYWADKDRAVKSAPYFAKFVGDLAEFTDIEELNLIVYSMGNTLFADAAESMVTKLVALRIAGKTKLHVIRVAHVAADMSHDEFRQVLSQYERLALELSPASSIDVYSNLYASDRDGAMWGSAVANALTSSRRAGLIFDHVFPPFIATKEASATQANYTVDASRQSSGPYGHGYYKGQPLILSDTACSFSDLRPGGNGRLLEELHSDNGRYWQLDTNTEGIKYSYNEKCVPMLLRRYESCEGLASRTGRSCKDEAKQIIAALDQRISSLELFWKESNCSYLTINFEFNDANVSAPDELRVRDFVRRVGDQNIKRIEIEGYSDRVGTTKDTYDLSVLRAHTVRSILADAGFSMSNIHMVGYGETRLAIQTEDNVPEERNRRVRIIAEGSAADSEPKYQCVR